MLDCVETFCSAPAPARDLARLHSPEMLERLESFSGLGGGSFDPDTFVSAGSWRAALLAAGAGLEAVRLLREGRGDGAFLAIRPPGHHATNTVPMGFCLLNNVGITAAALVAEGERVAIVDLDVHHGNGTQDAFYSESRVLYISFHESGLFPWTGHVHERGEGKAEGLTVNIPLPAGTSGFAYRVALDECVLGTIELFDPDWLLLSLGFDAHRSDPLGNLRLTSADFYDLTRRLLSCARPDRCIAFLEGGYDVRALSLSSAACVAAIAGRVYRPEAASEGTTGVEVVRSMFRQLDT